MNKIITIKSTELAHAKSGNQYLKVIGSDGKTYSIFQEGLWNILQGGSAVELTLEKNEKGYFNVTDAKSVARELAEKPVEKSEDKPEHHGGQETGMWWKEVGEMIRVGIIKKDTEVGGLYYRAYFARMADVLGLKSERKEE